ncbi:Protein PCP-3 [Aphelenchoides avenae]|nr:Protein PCP-3 [Aphelenchus avenae]
MVLVSIGRRFCLLLLAAWLADVDAGFRLHRREHSEQEIRQFKQEFGDDSQEEQWFEQKVDHFDPSSNATWKQRYWRAGKYGRLDGPQFLCIGGEGGSSPSDCSGAIARYARDLNATIWTVEHRFYGNSHPFGDFSTEHLRYLSSEQAVEDLANFIRTQNSARTISSPQWVLFGGSYPGSLALWTRQLHPELTVGAVGSSAPVEPILDFYQYMQVVEDALETFDPECPARVQRAISAFSDLLKTTEGRAELSQRFNVSLVDIGLSYNQTQSLFAGIFYSFNIQYHGHNETKRICDATRAADPLDGISRIIVGHYLSTDVYDKKLSWITDASFAGRAWYWQTCNEFGWFQSTDMGGGMFGDVFPVNWYINLCTDAFGPTFNTTYIEEAVRRTRRRYGGRDHYNGSNVVIPNGSLDPWHSMGFYGPYRPLDASAVVLFIKGTAHCWDMHDDINMTQIKEAQEVIFANVKKWVGHEIVEATTGAPLSTSDTVDLKPRKPKLNKLAAIAFDDQHRDAYLEDGTLTSEELAMLEVYRVRHGMGRRRKARRGGNLKPSDVTEGWIEQDLDHFNSSSFVNWKQRFFYTEKFYQPGGPVFLMFGGEGDASAEDLVSDAAYLEYAESHHAAVYLLEHRYYGESIPHHPQSSDAPYKHLSSEQALADAAQFIEAVNRYKGYDDPKLVSFGCSYAGALSAWFRQAYPNLVVGAVASSAPVQAKVDFYGRVLVLRPDKQILVEAYQVVQANLELYGDCEKNVRTAVRQVYELAQTEAGRAKLEQTFGNIPSAYDMPGTFIMGYLDNGFYKQSCSTMTQPNRTPLENLAALLGQRSPSESVGVDDIVRELLRSEKRWDRKVSMMDAWTYQTCNEFAFFTSTDYGNGTFASLAPVNHFVETCTELYGSVKDRRRVDEAVARTNRIYGGATNYSGTHVVFINGGADLWHALSVLTSRTSADDGRAEVTSFLVPEQPHCHDVHKDPEDPPQLIEARRRTNQLIGEWLH